MKLLFKQRLFSWFDSYDVYDEAGNTIYTVKGQLAWGHCQKIYNAQGVEMGMVQQRIFTLLPKFEIYIKDQYVGCISKEFTFLKPRYNIDFNGWHVQGDFMEWDYKITDGLGRNVATISKELIRWTDTYSIDVVNSADALAALMLVIAIDAEKCSRD